MGLFQGSHPTCEPRGSLPLIHPPLPPSSHARRQGAPHPLNQSYPIIPGGGRHHHLDDQPSRVHPKGTRAPFDRLPVVHAHLQLLLGALDTLRVETASAGLGVATLPAPLPMAKRRLHSAPDPVLSPPSHTALDGPPRPNVTGQQAPRAVGLAESATPVDDLSSLPGGTTSSPRAPLTWRQKRWESCPLILRHIGWIVTLGAHRGPRPHVGVTCEDG